MRLFLLVAMLWAGTAQAETVSLKSLMDQFNEVVFVHEHGKDGAEAKPIIKWVKKPIIYSPAGTLTRKQVDQFFTLMERIRKLTKLDMSMAKKGDKANLIIEFMPQVELAKKVQKGINCYGTIKANKDYEIIFARAYIPSDRPDKTDHCIVEETVQLFGLTNDSKLIEDSMFHEKSKRTSMTIADQILLKTLYDPRLKPGMKKEEAQPALRQILSDILTKAKNRKG